MIYFDAAATSMPKPPAVYTRALVAMRAFASPGRGGHRAAMRAAEAVYACREAAGALFDAEPERVVFTMNATHGLNIAIKTLLRAGDEAVISGFEHNAVTRPLHKLGVRTVVAGRKLFDPEDTLRAFDRAITEKTRAVICTHVSNVFGYILPVEKIAALCRECGVPLILDASQSAGVLPVHLRELGAAFIAMPGHKGLYGPQGTGILLCGRMPESLLEGGTGSLSELPQMPGFLPDAAEAGTQNVTGIYALSAGLEFIRQRGEKSILEHEVRLRRRLSQALREFPGAEIYEGAPQTGVLSVNFRGEDCERASQRLAEHGIAVRAGLHCAPLAHESAGTLQTGTVRFSFSAFNTERQVARAAAVLKNSEHPYTRIC